MGERIQSFRDLIVYKKAFELQQEVFALTRGFPREETYSLTDQGRRSSRSIGANIAEAWAKRAYPAHFVSKMTDSLSELNETEHWMDTAKACGYINAEQRHTMLVVCAEVGAMLASMTHEPEKWCQGRR